MRKRIAIIGAGISGLGAAWALHKDHDISVFEADSRVGGHANTVDVDTPGGTVAVDTGFIVYNKTTYPHLTSLFTELGVATSQSDMSLSFSRGADFEYGASIRGLLAQPSNLLSPRYRGMLSDINRFRRIDTDSVLSKWETIGEFLYRHGFSDGFVDDYLLPMVGAIWSSPSEGIGQFPAESILNFLTNHGLIEIVGRPEWRTVTGGSRSYVQRLTTSFVDRIHTDTPVTGVVRAGGKVALTAAGKTNLFDEIVLATHSDQALRILGQDASTRERALLESIDYQSNTAVLHSDPSLMPSRRAVWSSWNAMAGVPGDDRVSVTYWMNRLQPLDTAQPMFVTLNPTKMPDPNLIHAKFDYDHPVFDANALTAQAEMSNIQGMSNTWFAGAYLGYGFHEDGLQSGFNVAAALGSPPPWYEHTRPISSAQHAPMAAREA